MSTKTPTIEDHERCLVFLLAQGEALDKNYRAKKEKESLFAAKHKVVEDLLNSFIKKADRTDHSMTKGMIEHLEMMPGKAQQYVSHVITNSKRVSDRDEVVRKIQKRLGSYYSSYNKYYLESRRVFAKFDFCKKEILRVKVKIERLKESLSVALDKAAVLPAEISDGV